MRKAAALLTFVILALPAVSYAGLEAGEKLEIGRIAAENLPGHHVLIEKCEKGEHVVIGDIREGIYYEFYVLAPGYNTIEEGWSRPGYRNQAADIKKEVLRYLNRSGQEMLQPQEAIKEGNP